MMLKYIGLWLLIVAALISFIFNVDPTRSGFGTNGVPILRYLPYELSFLSLIIFMICIPAKFNMAALMITSFIIIMITGSLYSLLIIGVNVKETYLGRGVGGFVFLAGYYICFDKKLLSIFIKYYTMFFLFFSLIMLVNLVLFRLDITYYGLVQIYHVESILIISSAFLVDILSGGKIFKKILSACLIGSGFLIYKATNTVLSIVALLWSIRLFSNKIINSIARQNPYLRIVIYFIFTLVFLLFIFSLGYWVQSVISERIIDRENVIREFSLSLRWNSFLSHPFIGDLFTGTPQIDFGYLHIPSHLDLLDLLASGGLITVILFYYPMIYVIKKSIIPSLKNRFVFWQLFLFIALLIVMSVNPILETPRIGLIFFLSLGLLCGLEFKDTKLKIKRENFFKNMVGRINGA